MAKKDQSIKELESEIIALGVTPPELPDNMPEEGRRIALQRFLEKTKAVKAEGPKPPPEAIDLGVVDDQAAASAKILAELAREREQLARERDEFRREMAELREGFKAAPAGTVLTAEMLERILLKQQDGKTSNGLIRAEYIPEGDRLEAPIEFFSTYQNDYLSFLQIGGVLTPPPNNKKWLTFTNKFRWTVKTSQGPKVRSISVYQCKSRSEAEFIRKHPKFGISIFEESTRAIESGAMGEWGRMFESNLSLLGSVQDHQLPAMAMQYGVPVSQNAHPDSYRRAIAEAQTDQQVAEIRNAAMEERAERDQDRALLRSSGLAEVK